MQINNHTTLLVVSLIVVFLVVLVIFFIRRSRKLQMSSGTEQIYIGNLPYRTSERDLQKRFSRYGRINNVRIVKDRRTGRSKGYAFITFDSARDAKRSLADHGKKLGDRSLVVHIAKPRD